MEEEFGGVRDNMGIVSFTCLSLLQSPPEHHEDMFPWLLHTNYNYYTVVESRRTANEELRGNFPAELESGALRKAT